MVVAGVMVDEKDMYVLKNLGVKDSKLLTHKKRCLIAYQVEKVAKFKIVKSEPGEIDNAIDGDNDLNLNWLEAHKIAEIINFMKPDRAIVDCPSPNIPAYRAYLKKLLKINVEVICEHKADVNHPTVAAASILAKCEREKEVVKIEKKVGESIGSGYASNPVCREFIKKNYKKYPEIFRKSWSSFKNAPQKSLEEYSD